jgi:hypothetical protein
MNLLDFSRRSSENPSNGQLELREQKADAKITVLKTVVFETNKELPASKLPCTIRAHSLREIFHAIFYVLKSGCPRRLGTSPPLVNERTGRAALGPDRGK